MGDKISDVTFKLRLYDDKKIARVHSEHCQVGRGQPGSESEWWDHGYATVEAAEAAARQRGFKLRRHNDCL